VFHGRSVSEVSIPLPVTFSGVDKKLTGLSVDQVAGLVGQLPQGPTSQGSFQDVHFQVVSLVILGLVRKETGIVECRSIQRLPKFVADTLVQNSRKTVSASHRRQPSQQVHGWPELTQLGKTDAETPCADKAISWNYISPATESLYAGEANA